MDRYNIESKHAHFQEKNVVLKDYCYSKSFKRMNVNNKQSLQFIDIAKLIYKSMQDKFFSNRGLVNQFFACVSRVGIHCRGIEVPLSSICR